MKLFTDCTHCLHHHLTNLKPWNISRIYLKTWNSLKITWNLGDICEIPLVVQCTNLLESSFVQVFYLKKCVSNFLIYPKTSMNCLCSTSTTFTRHVESMYQSFINIWEHSIWWCDEASFVKLFFFATLKVFVVSLFIKISLELGEYWCFYNFKLIEYSTKSLL